MTQEMTPGWLKAEIKFRLELGEPRYTSRRESFQATKKALERAATEGLLESTDDDYS